MILVAFADILVVSHLLGCSNSVKRSALQAMRFGRSLGRRVEGDSNADRGSSNVVHVEYRLSRGSSGIRHSYLLHHPRNAIGGR